MNSAPPFNPNEWQSAAPKHGGCHQPGQPSNDIEADIEAITQAVEASGIDITAGYNNWLAIGFALADALGEGGAEYYQRLSRFHPDYSPTATARQYASCLRSKPSSEKQKITLSTFFYLALQHGIKLQPHSVSRLIDPQRPSKTSPKPQPSQTPLEGIEGTEGSIPEIPPTSPHSEFLIPHSELTPSPITNNPSPITNHLPTFSQSIKSSLPQMLQRIIADSPSAEDADILILGALTVFSACIPKVYGVYGQREVFSNLFLFVSAPASAGKGRLSLCRHLAEPIQQSLRNKYKRSKAEYDQELVAYNVNRKLSLGVPPKEPPFLTLFVPANSTATAVYQTLSENEGVGLIFETEGDTLSIAFNSDLGNFSDGFRKAFHHETISYLRRKDHEFVEILKPKFSAVLSGTPQQVSNLIPNAENGLFSRFIFYSLQTELVWRDMFSAANGSTADEHFRQIGKEFCTALKKFPNRPVQFTLTKSQQQLFNTFFADAQRDYAFAFGDDIVASVRRLGLILFRIAMILSVLRIMDHSPFPKGGQGDSSLRSPLSTLRSNLQIVCSDTDFQSALAIVKVLLEHTAEVFQTLPQSPGYGTTAPRGYHQVAEAARMRFFAALPVSFDRATFISVAASLGIPQKTAERYMRDLCESNQLLHPSKGQYEKPCK